MDCDGTRSGHQVTKGGMELLRDYEVPWTQGWGKGVGRAFPVEAVGGQVPRGD